MTMASSTTNPVAMVSAIKVRLLMENPARYITPKVPISDSGTAMAGMKVARALRRNRKITITTSATDSISSNFTSAIAARMVTVRSDSTVKFTAPGRVSRSAGSSFWMLSTTAITLAPGWRCTLMTIPGWRLTQAASSAFSGPCCTSATSDSRTGAPFL